MYSKECHFKINVGIDFYVNESHTVGRFKFPDNMFKLFVLVVYSTQYLN